ncbi:oligopeptide ABC transporter permease [Spongiactinospora sp. TRM90649]|uniref:oligopeptide ABC transporter permease n=1 Tax=Spongiactinospora sp. TRM90649 TaxID=3031114 RepID=UPI0023F822EC|nr:oligopeptide ABC transporter permease [Spongiactinospora sp. TRM90649]MDF5756388.1 ABC transporter permease [Spongiactinospora sp. TRM90649]
MTATTTTAGQVPGKRAPSASPRVRALRRFGRNRMAVAGAVVLGVVVLVTLLAPLIARHPPNAVDLDAVRQGPSWEHWFGTDTSGRDVFARTLYAGRVSLLVGLIAALAAITVGTLLGAVSGLFGGWADNVIMRAADIVMSFPTVVVILVLAGIVGPSMTVLITAIGLTQWPVAGRVVRGVTLSLRDREYIQASEAAGATPWWLIRKHIVPAALPPVTVTGTLAVAQAIMLETTASFLGLGVRPPQASWGNMLNDAQNLTLIQTMPWLWIPPGIAIVVTVLAVNFVGDGLRDAVNPAGRGGDR